MSERNFNRKVTFGFDTDAELDRKLIATLEAHGYRVTRSTVEPISVGALARLVNRSTASVSRCLRRPSCPLFEATYGNGTKRRMRILSLTPNERLLAHLTL